jgi:hypothetical protein
MFFWKKPQKTTLNRSVVEIEYFINDAMFLDLEEAESPPNHKDFLSVYKAALLPTGDKHIVFVPNDRTGTCFYNKLETVVDTSSIIGNDTFPDFVTISWWNCNLHIYTDKGLCNLLAPHKELDNLMLFGKTSFISENYLIINKQDKLSIPSSFEDGNPVEWEEIMYDLSEKEVTYYNETASIRIRANSAPEPFSVSLSN